jgi:hypothetical protein
VVQTGVPVGTPFPTWLTHYPTTNVVINTSDALGVAVYTFEVVAFEPLTGLKNNACTFKVTSSDSNEIISMTVITATRIPDQVYLVGDPTIVLPPPYYDYFPTYCTVQFNYEQASTHPFVSVVFDAVSGWQI